jgi:hypothetical protein
MVIVDIEPSGSAITVVTALCVVTAVETAIVRGVVVVGDLKD